MLPGHCKDVAVKEVHFELNSENISENIRGKSAYTRCEYYVLKHDDKTAVIEITKEDGSELFRPITSHRIVSLPEETIYLKDETIDVINIPAMAEVSKRYPDMTVVVEGKFGHVSFADKNSFVCMSVVDVVPPYPSKLSALVKTALESGMVEIPVTVEYENIDINELAENAVEDVILFPCKASGIKSGKKDYYLDQLPEIKEECVLIGCELSERIYNNVYKKEIKRIEMCPNKLSPKDNKKKIVKCCRIRNGHRIEGNTAIVPWGATVQEVADAINGLFSEEFVHNSSL